MCIHFFYIHKNNIYFVKLYTICISLAAHAFTYMQNILLHTIPKSGTPGGCHPFPWPKRGLPGPSCPMSIAEQLHALDDWDPPGSLKSRNEGIGWRCEHNNNFFGWPNKKANTLSITINDVKDVGLIIFSLNLLICLRKMLVIGFVSGNLQLLGSTV